MKRKAKKPNKKAIAAAIAVLLAAGGSYGGYTLVKAKSSDTATSRVTRAVDGDTIDTNAGRVRLLGVDAPESGECYFDEAKAALKSYVEGDDVLLERDVVDRDKYGRLLRYVKTVTPKGSFINAEMVRYGFAYASPSVSDTKYRDLLLGYENEAQKAKRGVWGACEQGSAEALQEIATPSPSSECTIKGNISEKGYGRIYFVEGCPNYARIKVDTRKGESWFCSEAEAQKAGFTKSASCANTFN